MFDIRDRPWQLGPWNQLGELPIMYSRRIFLRNALLVSAGTWTAGLGLMFISRNLRSWFFPRRLPGPVFSWLASAEFGAAAGRALDLRRRERGVLLDRTAGLLTRAATDPDGSFEPILREHIQADFAAGRIVDADGWQLAETEVGVFLLQAEIRKGNFKAS